MIANDADLAATLERIARVQAQLRYLRRNEPDPAAYRASASGFISELDRMQLDVREYFSRHPAEAVGA